MEGMVGVYYGLEGGDGMTVYQRMHRDGRGGDGMSGVPLNIQRISSR